MIKKLFAPWSMASHRLFSLWRAIPIFLVLYLAILAAIYFFSSTGLATLPGVFATLILAVLAPILFFILQSMSVSYVQQETGSAGALFLRSLKGFWKLIVLAAPFIALAVLTVFLIAKVPAAATPAVAAARLSRSASGSANNAGWFASHWGEWRTILLTAVELILLLFVLPLATIHIWISAASIGFVKAVKGAGRTILNAFKPFPVLIYIVGAIIFGVLPYFLIVTRTTSKSPWLELSLLALRLVLAATLNLFGWVITMGALAERAASPEHQ